MFLSIRHWNGQKNTRAGTMAGDRFNGILTLTGEQFGQLFGGTHGGSLKPFAIRPGMHASIKSDDVQT